MDYTIIHNSLSHRFETVVEGTTAYVEYIPFDGGLKIMHTIVPALIEGQGIAAALTKYVLEYARDAKIKIVPICSYSVVYIKRHAEYQDLLQ